MVSPMPTTIAKNYIAQKQTYLEERVLGHAGREPYLVVYLRLEGLGVGPKRRLDKKLEVKAAVDPVEGGVLHGVLRLGRIPAPVHAVLGDLNGVVDGWAEVKHVEANRQ